MIKKKKKLKSISSIKKKVWRLFSEFIRKRGANDLGLNSCVTCGKVEHWKSGQAGHYFHGHNKQTFLDERNVNFQCVKCNHFLSGNLIEYTEFMGKKYGQEGIDELRNLSRMIWKPSRTELAELIERYSK